MFLYKSPLLAATSNQALRRSAIAHVYPAYRSYQVLQCPDGRPEDSVNRWLTYWGVLGLFHTVEAVTDSFIWWIPFYDEAKILVVLWLALPEAQVRLSESHAPLLCHF